VPQRVRLFSVWGWVALFAMAGCGRFEARRANQPYAVVTTVAMVKDIVQRVAGSHARVEGLIGEGVDPHLYKPTRDDAASGKPVFAVTELIDESYLLSPPESQGHHDPHVWMDVSAWMKATERVAEALAKYDPAHAADYTANAQAYLAELAALDAYAKSTLQTIPPSSRVLVTAHDAFNYFGRAYGLEVRGIQGISTESEAGLQDLRKLVDLLVERNIGAVFVETSVAEKNVRALVEGAQARGHAVVIGGSLFSDAMGPAGTYEGTYVGMIDHNVTTIARALGGRAPAGGMQGMLAR
jgi:manganese/zinc/iron transport system substrate-binding protein